MQQAHWFGVYAGKQSFLQFQTSYVHPSGRRRLRVTTLSYRFAEQSTLDIAPGRAVSHFVSKIVCVCEAKCVLEVVKMWMV